MSDVLFYAHGVPVPKGSISGFPVRRRDGSTGVAMATKKAAGTGPWMAALASSCSEAARIHGCIEGPVMVGLLFRLPRPKSRPKRDVWPDRKPDIDKLARAVLDAMTGVVLRDDALVVTLLAEKRYADPDQPTGVWVQVRRQA